MTKAFFVPDTLEEALEAAGALLDRAGELEGHDRIILLEDRVRGEECSLIGYCDGRRVVFGPEAQDYKFLEDGDRGPNTGGMGAVCPVEHLRHQERVDLAEKLTPMVQALEYPVYIAPSARCTRGPCTSR